MIQFSPAPGHVEVVQPDAVEVQIYLTTDEVAREQIYVVQNSKQRVRYEFLPVLAPAICGEGEIRLQTWQATIPLSLEPLYLDYIVSQDGKEKSYGSVSILREPVNSKLAAPFKLEVILSENEFQTSIKIPWLELEDWEGWLWVRSRPTWVEPRFVSLLEMPVDHQTQVMLLRHKRNPSTVLFIAPVSTSDVLLHLSPAQQGEPSGVYIRARRGNGSTATVSTEILSYQDCSGDTSRAIREVMTKAVKQVSAVQRDDSPFDELGFCTWSSLGEFVRPTKDNMSQLVTALAENELPIGTFIIDDGWQDVRPIELDDPDNEALWSFGSYDGLGGTLKQAVDEIKRKLPTVKHVGVWMSIQGYWNGTAPSSPLISKYNMSRYRLDGSRIPKIKTGNDGHLAKIVNARYSPSREWYLPHPSKAFDFWNDYFETCAAAGITTVKVDNQASMSLLEGFRGAEIASAMWNGMFAAANKVFGPGRVIHCMSHNERMFIGDIATGLATNGQPVMFRNTNDFNLPAYTQPQHISYNIYNALVLSHTCLVLDADMFMTTAQWPSYHAVLRAFFPGPILLSDFPGDHNLTIINSLFGKTSSGRYQAIRTPTPLRPLPNRVWENALSCDSLSLKAYTRFPNLQSAVIVAWSNSQIEAPTIDLVTDTDIQGTLGESGLDANDYSVWFSNARTVVPLVNNRKPEDQEKVISNLVATLVLPPQAHEVLRVVPAIRLSGRETRISCLGLLDKYAGLAAIKEVSREGDILLVHVLYQGNVGFVTNSRSVKLMVDGKDHVGKFTDLGSDNWLLEVQLQNHDSSQSDSSVVNRGGAGWVLEVSSSVSSSKKECSALASAML